MSSDRLIDELRGGARELAPGEFTLDREQARAKLRQFQLADPRRYVLFLVEAAVLRGATRVDFAIDADDVRCSFDGSPFTAEDFDRLYGSLFVSADDDATRARRALALGLNAAMALNPRWVRIDSGDGAAGVRLELRVDRPDAIGSAPEPPTGTRIHVKSRFRAGLAMAFVRNLAGAIAEERWLREHCRFARVPITLDGKPVSFGFEDPLLATPLGRAPIEGPGLTGVACFHPEWPATPKLGLLSAGVLVAWHAPPGPAHCVGVVESRDFRRDASQADVVRDAAFDRAMSAWWDAADAALAAAVERIPFGEPGKVLARCRAALEDALERRHQRFVAHWNVGAALDAVSAGLARAPLWHTLRGDLRTTAELLDAVAGGGNVRYSLARFAELPEAEGRGVLALDGAAERELLGKLFPGRTVDATQELQGAAERERARQRFLGRRAEPTLPQRAGYQVVEPLRGDGVTGEVALGGAQLGAFVRFVRDGCLLAEKRVESPFVKPPHGMEVAAVLVGAFAPNDSYDDVVADELLGRAVVALLEGLERAMRRLCADPREVPRYGSDPRRLPVLSWLRLVLDGNAVRETLRGLGASNDEAERLETLVSWEDPRSRLGLGRFRGAPAGRDALHPAARVALFERAGGPPVDLWTIDLELRARGRVRHLAGRLLGEATDERLLLAPSPSDLEVLRLVFGAEALHDVTDEWLARQRQALHEQLPAERLGPDPRGFESVPFRAEGLEGRLDVLSTPAVAPVVEEAGALQPMELRILRRGRFLGRRKVGMLAGSLAAAVDGEEVRTDPEWTDVRDPGFEARAHAAAAAALVPLTERLGSERERLPAGRREAADRVLLEAACGPFPAPAFADAWSALRAALPFEEARTVLLRLLSWVGWMPLEDVETALTIALEATVGDGSSPTVLPERVATCLSRDDRPAVEAAPVPAHATWLAASEDDPVWPMPGALRRTALFRSVGDLPVTPGQLAARLLVGERVGWVAPDVPVDSDGERLVIRLDPAAQALLAQTLGPQRLEDCNEETRRRQRLRRLESVPRLERIALEDGEALLVEPLLDGRLTGEVGLAADPDAGPSVLTICADHRPVAKVEGFSRLALRAVVNDDNLQFEAGTANPAAGEAERLARLCEQLVPGLFETLAARWSGLDEARQATAWRHLLDVLALNVPHAGGRSRKDGRAYLRAASGVPGFRTRSGGRRTLVELEALAERVGGVFVVPPDTPLERLPALGRTTTPDTTYLVVADAREKQRLRRLFPKVTNWLNCPDDWKQTVQHRSELPPLPNHKPVAKLVKTKFDRGGLSGQLFLPRDPVVPLEASFGREGLELARRPLSELLPCAGVVVVPASAVRPGWTGVELTPEQERTLEKPAVQLYRMLLAARFDQADANDDRVRDLLADAVLRLQRAAVEAGGHLQGETGALLRDLKRIPLVRRGKKRVRLDKLLRSRPADLEPLGLWAGVPAAAPTGEGEADAVSEAAPAAAVAPAPATSPPAWPEVPVPETAEERGRRFLDRLAEELQRLWPKEDRKNVRRAVLGLVFGKDEQPARYGTGAVTVHGLNPLVRGALATFEDDPVPLWLLVSTLATQANLDFTRITDEHERAMQLALVERLAEGPGPAGG
ncbi:MAG: hypothetical protein JXB32_21225 [Deltaproteobacteria bacterium]|nr:hypothetical protein [Deltaproteobacteria bacterium]